MIISCSNELLGIHSNAIILYGTVMSTVTSGNVCATLIFELFAGKIIWCENKITQICTIKYVCICEQKYKIMKKKSIKRFCSNLVNRENLHPLKLKFIIKI